MDKDGKISEETLIFVTVQLFPTMIKQKKICINLNFELSTVKFKIEKKYCYVMLEKSGY